MIAILIIIILAIKLPADNKLKLENIILRHEQNNFSVNKELLPVDNVPFNESLDAGQLTGLLIDYSLYIVNTTIVLLINVCLDEKHIGYHRKSYRT